MSIADELREAEDRVEAIKRRIASSTCREVGCDMQFIGGMNAGCGESCGCSVPVHACIRCGDSDYGDNPEANEKRASCARDDA